MKPPEDSRTAEKFVIRLKPGQRNRLMDLALTQNQSMNEVAISALERYFDQQRRIEVLLDTLEQAAGRP